MARGKDVALPGSWATEVAREVQQAHHDVNAKARPWHLLSHGVPVRPHRFRGSPPPHPPDLVGPGLVADDVRGHGRQDPGEMSVRAYVRAY